MSIRDEKKQQTRNTLLEAALSLMSDGRSFVSISLREVTREAGVVPTAFYRHFRDMDELGLALVDEVCLNLRRLLREERVKAQGAGHIAIKSSVMMFLLYVKQEARYFDFLARERWSGSSKIREAIQREIRHFSSDLSSDLRLFPEMQNLPSEDLQMISDLVINTAMNWCGEILSLPSEQVRLQYELSM
ncbi:MAG TPA: HTH-type transcriptional repressor FabR, partial [Agitococcus sp.]|nr:HTH-type transcriptional repressor FabR [Agitococcus sp.]